MDVQGNRRFICVLLAILVWACTSQCIAQDIRDLPKTPDIKIPSSFRAIPMFNSKRQDVEIETTVVQKEYQNNIYRVYLVDKSRDDLLPNMQTIPAQRVYQFPDIKSDIKPIMCLDDKCNLVVLTRMDNQITVKRYEPGILLSPEFSEKMVGSPEDWARVMARVDKQFKLLNKYAVFGEPNLVALESVSTDVLVPDTVKEEQRSKLRSGIVALLNSKLLAWRESLEEVYPMSQNDHIIQELWLAKQMRAQREAIAKGSKPSEDYWHKLRQLNRIVLCDMMWGPGSWYRGSGGDVIYRSLRFPVGVGWSVDIPKPDSKKLEPDVRLAFETLYDVCESCTIRVGANGRVEFAKDNASLPVALDAKTGDIIEPLMRGSLKVQDVPIRVNNAYVGEVNDPINHQFAIRIKSYEPDSQSFTGLIYWKSYKTPNRIKGDYKNGVLSWYEYRNVLESELPGAVFRIVEDANGYGKLTFTVLDGGAVTCNAVGSLDLRPSVKNQYFPDLPNNIDEWGMSPHATDVLPAWPTNCILYPLKPFPALINGLSTLTSVDVRVTHITGTEYGDASRSENLQFRCETARPRDVCGGYLGDENSISEWNLYMVMQRNGLDVQNERATWIVENGKLVTQWGQITIPKNLSKEIKYRPEYDDLRELPVGRQRLYSVTIKLSEK